MEEREIMKGHRRGMDIRIRHVEPKVEDLNDGHGCGGYDG